MKTTETSVSSSRFKWICLAVAIVFLGLAAWMLNDIRRAVRRSTGIVEQAGATVNEQLPSIVDKSKQTTDVVAEHLPQMVAEARETTATLAELSADIKQLKELAGVSNTARDKNLVAYADKLLDEVERSGGVVGKDKTFGSGLKDTQPAKEWVVGARKEALLLTVLAKSQEELLERLSHTKFGSAWQLKIGDDEPVALDEWLKEKHPPQPAAVLPPPN